MCGESERGKGGKQKKCLKGKEKRSKDPCSSVPFILPLSRPSLTHTHAPPFPFLFSLNNFKHTTRHALHPPPPPPNGPPPPAVYWLVRFPFLHGSSILFAPKHREKNRKRVVQTKSRFLFFLSLSSSFPLLAFPAEHNGANRR